MTDKKDIENAIKALELLAKRGGMVAVIIEGDEKEPDYYIMKTPKVIEIFKDELQYL
jgi:hypothetical protein